MQNPRLGTATAFSIVTTNTVVFVAGGIIEIVERTYVVPLGARLSTMLSPLGTECVCVLITCFVGIAGLAILYVITESCLVIPVKLGDEFHTIVIEVALLRVRAAIHRTGVGEQTDNHNYNNQSCKFH